MCHFMMLAVEALVGRVNHSQSKSYDDQAEYRRSVPEFPQQYRLYADFMVLSCSCFPSRGLEPLSDNVAA